MSSSASFNNANGKAKVLGAFGLADHEVAFMRLLTRTQSMIAGGAALTWWAAAHDPATVVPEGQDLDVWVRVPTLDAASRFYPMVDVLDLLWETFLSGVVGFHKQTPRERAAEMRSRTDYSAQSDALMYRKAFKMIRRIQNYIHPETGRKVQLIFVRTDKIVSVLDNYDLDICRFNIHQCREELYVFNPPGAKPEDLDAMRAGQMKLFNIRDNRMDGTRRRVAKYYGRGYYFFEAKPCPTCFHVDKKKLTAEEAHRYVRSKFAEDYEASRAAAAPAPALVLYDDDEVAGEVILQPKPMKVVKPSLRE